MKSMMYFRKMLYLPYLIAVFIAILPSINAASPPVQMNEEIISFPTGVWIFKEGQKADGYYQIEEGKVAVLKTSNQKEKLITTLGKGDIFGEMAIVDGKPRSASIKTLTKTKLVFISTAEFKKRLDSLDPWAVSLIKTLSSRLRKTTDDLAKK